MPSPTPEQGEGLVLRVPSVLSLKDLITIVSVAVTLTAAWGVFSTRITVLEREVVALQTADKAQENAIDKLQQQTSRLTAYQQDDELLIDQAFLLLKRNPPVRRAHTLR
jgi:hypothetical protein